MLTLLFNATSATFALPQDLLSSLCFIESSHRVSAIHLDDGGTNSIGICEIKLSTAKWLGFSGSEKQLMEPSINIYYAGKYLAYQLARYNGNFPRAITAYNKGSSTGSGYSQYYNKVSSHWKKHSSSITIANNP